jgi:hypothetical protein
MTSALSSALARPLPAAFLLATLLAVSACAPTGEAGRSSSGPISATEIQSLAVSGTAYDVVATLRPQWLQTRGPRGIGIRVYMDGLRIGDTSQTLQNILADNVGRIERLSAAEATARYGTSGGGHGQGAILVTTRR